LLGRESASYAALALGRNRKDSRKTTPPHLIAGNRSQELSHIVCRNKQEKSIFGDDLGMGIIERHINDRLVQGRAYFSRE
jgi:hypothetical protein